MPLIRPFPGLRPAAGHAEDVLAPPYDVLNTREARDRTAGRPWSFLHVSKPEIDLPEGTDPDAPEVYAKGRENFRRMLAEGVIEPDPAPCYYLYRLIMGDHVQTGLVAAASVEAYEAGRIRKHEFTRPDKEDDRVRQIDALDAQTGPVFLTYRHDTTVDALVERLCRAAPDVDVTADDGVRHTLWPVSDPEAQETITARFEAMERLYVADGHHRSAAASRVAAKRRAANPAHNGDEPYNYFLAVIFPDNQMQILDYNRVVADLGGRSVEAFVEAVSEAFDRADAPEPFKPARSGEFGMYLAGRWHRLSIKPERVPADPVGRLDVSLLQTHLIEPVLGIRDPRRDKRIDFVGGIRGLDELERRVDSGEMAVAFSLHPTTLAQLMAVADADEVMPPKSTWFEPKLADGLVSHSID